MAAATQYGRQFESAYGGDDDDHDRDHENRTDYQGRHPRRTAARYLPGASRRGAFGEGLELGWARRDVGGGAELTSGDWSAGRGCGVIITLGHGHDCSRYGRPDPPHLRIPASTPEPSVRACWQPSGPCAGRNCIWPMN